jgi:hypothetical protein
VIEPNQFSFKRLYRRGEVGGIVECGLILKP